MLAIRDISKIYDGRRGRVTALGGVSLNAAPGSFVAVQGPSGSGKTTLLLAAGGLLVPDSGSVRVGGSDIYGMSAEARAGFRASGIGFVFQQFHLVPYLSVLENVLTPSMAHREPDAEERAVELLGRFNMSERAGHLPSELSTGERQRTALARALLNRPKLLLADEPTGNLDRDNAATVLAAFEEFARDGGAVLLVTHDDNVARSAHRKIVLIDGRIHINDGN